VEFIEKINWREQGCSLKLALHTNIENEDVIYNWESSRIARGLNNPKRFEMPSKLWVDISNKQYGISIIEDSKYGYDHPQKDILRLTLLYTPSVHKLRGFWDQMWQDWGEHTIRYAIYAHEGDYRSGTDAFARRFNQRIRPFLITNDKSTKSKAEVSLLQNPTPQLGVIAVKKAEDIEGIIIRCYERFGEPLSTELNFAFPIQTAKEVNGREEILKDTEFNGCNLKVNMEANGIRSYLIQFKDISQVDEFKSKPLPLEYNYGLIGTKQDTQSIFPVELLTDKIHAGSIEYTLELTQKNNALQCHSQKILIPNDYNTISLLLGSEKPSEISIRWLDGSGLVLKENTIHRAKTERTRWPYPS
jgi:alpha-mannosidase